MATPDALRPGRLIALEGVDGCGKSTQARLLAQASGALCTAEPGGTPLGAALRRVLLDPDLPEASPRAEALLMLADRAEHVDQVLLPALGGGRWVVTDRYSGSTLAYQGHGRGLDLGALAAVERWAANGQQADLVVLIEVPLDVARARMARRAGGAAADRMERQGRPFQRRVDRGFAALAAADPRRWARVDGAGAPQAVAAKVRAVVEERLGSPPGGWR